MEQLLDLISDFNYQLRQEMDAIDPEVQEELLYKLEELDVYATRIHSELIDLIYNK